MLGIHLRRCPISARRRVLRILAIGAHPDDCELKCGGTAALWCKEGHVVRLVSATDGSTGHHRIGGIELTRRRQAETKAAADLIGAESQVLEIPSGELVPSLEHRATLIRLIRGFAPDLILTHRVNDYHPDHRAAGQLVQDASYVITVPNNQPLTPALRKMPVILHFQDRFKKPVPFQADVAVSIDAVFGKKVEMAHCHVSQMYEWLPYSRGELSRVPRGDGPRKAWLRKSQEKRDAAVAAACRDKLEDLYGDKRGGAVRFAEAFEVCEYGAPLPPERIRELFPFLPAK